MQLSQLLFWELKNRFPVLPAQSFSNILPTPFISHVDSPALVNRAFPAVNTDEMQDQLPSVLNELGNAQLEHAFYHPSRTVYYFMLLVRELEDNADYREITGEENMPKLFQAALWHDVGKLSVRPELLSKPLALSCDEFTEMQNHTLIGAAALRCVRYCLGESDILQQAEEMALLHQEHWNGSGYPLGLEGESIPPAARVLALADVYDALSHPRSYKKAFSHEQVTDIFIKKSGSHFAPAVVNAFLKVEKSFNRMRNYWNRDVDSFLDEPAPIRTIERNLPARILHSKCMAIVVHALQARESYASVRDEIAV